MDWSESVDLTDDFPDLGEDYIGTNELLEDIETNAMDTSVDPLSTDSIVNADIVTSEINPSIPKSRALSPRIKIHNTIIIPPPLPARSLVNENEYNDTVDLTDDNIIESSSVSKNNHIIFRKPLLEEPQKSKSVEDLAYLKSNDPSPRFSPTKPPKKLPLKIFESPPIKLQKTSSPKSITSEVLTDSATSQDNKSNSLRNLPSDMSIMTDESPVKDIDKNAVKIVLSTDELIQLAQSRDSVVLNIPGMGQIKLTEETKKAIESQFAELTANKNIQILSQSPPPVVISLPNKCGDTDCLTNTTVSSEPSPTQLQGNKCLSRSNLNDISSHMVECSNPVLPLTPSVETITPTSCINEISDNNPQIIVVHDDDDIIIVEHENATPHKQNGVSKSKGIFQKQKVADESILQVKMKSNVKKKMPVMIKQKQKERNKLANLVDNHIESMASKQVTSEVKQKIINRNFHHSQITSRKQVLKTKKIPKTPVRANTNDQGLEIIDPDLEVIVSNKDAVQANLSGAFSNESIDQTQVRNISEGPRIRVRNFSNISEPVVSPSSSRVISQLYQDYSNIKIQTAEFPVMSPSGPDFMLQHYFNSIQNSHLGSSNLNSVKNIHHSETGNGISKHSNIGESPLNCDSLSPRILNGNLNVTTSNMGNTMISRLIENVDTEISNILQNPILHSLLNATHNLSTQNKIFGKNDHNHSSVLTNSALNQNVNKSVQSKRNSRSKLSEKKHHSLVDLKYCWQQKCFGNKCSGFSKVDKLRIQKCLKKLTHHTMMEEWQSQRIIEWKKKADEARAAERQLMLANVKLVEINNITKSSMSPVVALSSPKQRSVEFLPCESDIEITNMAELAKQDDTQKDVLDPIYGHEDQGELLLLTKKVIFNPENPRGRRRKKKKCKNSGPIPLARIKWNNLIRGYKKNIAKSKEMQQSTKSPVKKQKSFEEGHKTNISMVPCYVHLVRLEDLPKPKPLINEKRLSRSMFKKMLIKNIKEFNQKICSNKPLIILNYRHLERLSSYTNHNKYNLLFPVNSRMPFSDVMCQNKMLKSEIETGHILLVDQNVFFKYLKMTLSTV